MTQFQRSLIPRNCSEREDSWMAIFYLKDLRTIQWHPTICWGGIKQEKLVVHPWKLTWLAGKSCIFHRRYIFIHLVGGFFPPIWKNMLVKLDHFPNFRGWKIKNISNHHLVYDYIFTKKINHSWIGKYTPFIPMDPWLPHRQFFLVVFSI